MAVLDGSQEGVQGCSRSDFILVHLHLLGEELFTPFVLVDVVPDELDSLFPGYLHARLSFLMVVDPELCPPS